MKPEAGYLRVTGADQHSPRNPSGKSEGYSMAPFSPDTHYQMTGIWRKKSPLYVPEASGLIARISSSPAVNNFPGMAY